MHDLFIESKCHGLDEGGQHCRPGILHVQGREARRKKTTTGRRCGLRHVSHRDSQAGARDVIDLIRSDNDMNARFQRGQHLAHRGKKG